MTMLTSTLENIGLGDGGIAALLGYAVVFFGLILLMIVVMIMGKIFVAQAAKKPQQDARKAEKKAAKEARKAAKKGAAPVETPVAAPVAAVEPTYAPGTAGQLKLHDVPPKTAAMIMAIVADKMGKPLNELRFISIKEVK